MKPLERFQNRRIRRWVEALAFRVGAPAFMVEAPAFMVEAPAFRPVNGRPLLNRALAPGSIASGTAFATLALLLLTTIAWAKPSAVTLTGTVQDCAGGKAAAVHAIEVYAFDAARYARIRSALEKMSRLWEQVESVGGEGRFLRQYDDLARQVKAARGAVPHVRTDANGDYKLRALQPGRRYILLAIDLEADGEACYEYALTGPLKPGTHQFDLWMSPEAQAECRPMLNAGLRH